MMRPRKCLFETFCIAFAFCALFQFAQLSYANPALAEHVLLKRLITAYHSENQKERLQDGSYRGDEGILSIRPEAARIYGMKVFIDRNYQDSLSLLEKADKHLEMAETAMETRKKEKFPGEHVRSIVDHFLIFKQSQELAKSKLTAYRSRLKKDVDDRLNGAVSGRVMDRLLAESLRKKGNKLRDALGWFYNVCQVENEYESSLTPENITFVNAIFRQFVEQASEETLETFDLDRDNGDKTGNSRYRLRTAISKRNSKYIPLVQAAYKKNQGKTYSVDPLLFLALIKAESNFDHLAVSSVGAAGLTQMMPKTAKALGMKNIYMPPYFKKAGTLLVRERKAIREANAALHQITEENGRRFAGRARDLMQRALALAREKARLFDRYKRDLLRTKGDDRLQAEQSIEYGLRYFASMMKKQNGDISLALASYNAGPHRVQEYKGIPPYTETVRFRNRILKYYGEYLRKAEKST